MFMFFHRIKIREKIYHYHKPSDNKKWIFTKYRWKLHLTLILFLTHIYPRKYSRLDFCSCLQNTVNFSNILNYIEILTMVFYQVLTIFQTKLRSRYTTNTAKTGYNLDSLMGGVSWAIEVKDNRVEIGPIELQTLHTTARKWK